MLDKAALGFVYDILCILFYCFSGILSVSEVLSRSWIRGEAGLRPSEAVVQESFPQTGIHI